MSNTTDGRMIRKNISNSKGFANLSPQAAVLFCMIIPHLNSHGKMNGGVGYIKDEVCPRISYLTFDNLTQCLLEINTNTNIKWFEYEGRHYIHAINFYNHQKLKMDRLGVDKLPSYSGESPHHVQSKSGLSPEQVPPEVEEEIEVEEQGKSGVGQPVYNSKSVALFLNSLQGELAEIVSCIINIKPDCVSQVENFLINNSSAHPEAIIHSLQSLLNQMNKGKSINFPIKYLNSILEVENGKYNARDEEIKTGQYKKSGMMSMRDILSGIHVHCKSQETR